MISALLRTNKVVETAGTGKPMDLSSFTPIIGVFGLLIGSTTTYVFGVRSEIRKMQMALRRDAYVDFIKSVAAISISQNSGKEEKEVHFILMTEAKIRISIYGSKAVVSALADFFRQYGSLNSPEACTSFAILVSLMRREASTSKSMIVPLRDVSQLLFGTELEPAAPKGNGCE